MADTQNRTPVMKDWTLMFYFASDNPLAPGIVTQLKAIKQAGFHHEANVIAHFDPQPEGAPTHIFDVNIMRKLKCLDPPTPKIGFIGHGPDDPYVSKLMEDKLWRDDQTDRDGNKIKGQIQNIFAKGLPYNPPEPPAFRSANNSEDTGDHPGNHQETGPEESLSQFLEFCSVAYPARHYMLFILGHGVVVGNDLFLFDEHAATQSLQLRQLGTLLTRFSHDINNQKDQNNQVVPGTLELISLHSCSMSSAEVAYELQGTANYLLASQGPAFVGSWPYRQILIRVFKALERYGRGITDEQIKGMLTDIFSYCLHNSADFMLAGYSFDLCLCNLRNVTDIKRPLQSLSSALRAGLQDPLLKSYILLAHLKSQSFWQETYTDLYDFCFCLSRLCEEYAGEMSPEMKALHTAAGDVMNKLIKEIEDGDDNLIVRSEFAGPAYQFSHGLSIFLPWAKPSDDSLVMKEYEQYKFKETSWVNFLTDYFSETMRAPRVDERDENDERVRAARRRSDVEKLEDELREDMSSLLFNQEGPLSQENTLGGGGPPKTHPDDPTGDECTCASIKNYPRDTRPRRQRVRNVGKGKQVTPISPTFFDM